MDYLKILNIIIVAILFFIVLLNLNKIIISFLNSLVKFETYKVSISRGTNRFIESYKEKICKFIDTNYNEKNFEEEKMKFNIRFDKAIKSAVAYVHRPIVFIYIECLIKKTKDEKELIKNEYFFKEFTNIIKDLDEKIKSPKLS